MLTPSGRRARVIKAHRLEGREKVQVVYLAGTHTGLRKVFDASTLRPIGK